MAFTYNPTDWHTGDVITEGKLNNIEDGIKGLYPTPAEIIAPEQTITITENTPMTGVPITLAEGKSIDLDLFMCGGYYIPLSFELDGVSTMLSFYHSPECEVDTNDETWTGKILTAVGSGIDETYLPFTIAKIVYDVPNQSLSFMVAHTMLDVPGLVPFPGEFTISITKIGLSAGTAIPKFLYDNVTYNDLYMSSIDVCGVSTVGEDKGNTIDCTMVNMENLNVASLPFNSMIHDGVVHHFDVAVPVVIIPYQQPEGSGWYITQPVEGLPCILADGSLVYLIPDTTPITWVDPDSID